MGSSVVNLISVGVALVAVAVAVWQVRTSTERAERALSLPIITEIAREIRSSEFRQNFIYLQNAVQNGAGGSFAICPGDTDDNQMA